MRAHYVQIVQSIRTEFTDQFFLFLNTFDTFLPYLVILAITWHLKDRKKGFHLICLQSLSVLVYASLKYFFAEPRPYELMPSLKILATSGYGFPSGAALSSMITLGFVGFFLPPYKLLLRGLSILLVLLIGITRVYLGAHFPSDVIGGWIAGFIILVSYGCSIAYIEEKNSPLSKVLALLIGLLAIIIFLWIRFSVDVVVVSSILLGALIGYVFLQLKTQKNSFVSSIIAVVGIIFLYKIFSIVGHASMSSIQKILLIVPISFLMGLWLSISERLALYFKKQAQHPN